MISTVTEVSSGLRIPHGFGKATYDDDTTYVGIFSMGHRDGKGYFKLANGDKYLGEFSRNIEHGLGNRTYRGDGWFSGMWSSGSVHGIGRRRWGNGNVYSGSWKRGKTDGVGELLYANGDKYTGHWNRGVEDGYGTHTYALLKESYVGIWKKGVPHGYGKYTYSNGNYYLGDWRNGTAHGVGQTYYNQTGDSFYGHMRKGEKHGKGEYHLPSIGMVIIGEWKKGNRVGESRTEMIDGRGFGFSFPKAEKKQTKLGSNEEPGSRDLLTERAKRRRPGYPSLDQDLEIPNSVNPHSDSNDDDQDFEEQAEIPEQDIFL